MRIGPCPIVGLSKASFCGRHAQYLYFIYRIRRLNKENRLNQVAVEPTRVRLFIVVVGQRDMLLLVWILAQRSETISGLHKWDS